jgi:DNA-binding IclR family transcriptional regulator
MAASRGIALQKGLTILEAVGSSAAGHTAQELADIVGVHKTNVYHYLKVLEAARYVRRDEQGRFHLGYRVLELGGQLLQRMPLREMAHAHLLRLSHRTSKTIHLGVLEGTELLYLDKIEGPNTLPMRSRVGTRAPVHCTASGKALLAHLPLEEQQRILSHLTLERRTPSTIVDRDQLAEELRVSVERGYAVDHGENEEHVCCFAAPIFDQSGRAVAAISLTGLSSEWVEPEEHKRLRRLVLETAAEISRERGYSPPVGDSDGSEGQAASDRLPAGEGSKG